MPIVRGGYGFGAFSYAEYGTEGVVHDGAASTVVSSTASASGGKSLVGDGVCTSTSNTSVSVQVTRNTSASVTSGSVVTATADAFRLEDTSSTAYGSGAYGVLAYTESEAQIIVSSTSVSSTASCERVRPDSASVSSVSTTDSDCERIKLGISQADAVASTTASGAFTISSSAEATGTSSTTSACVRKRETGGTITAINTFEASGRYKYEQIAKDNETWNDVSASGGTWTEVA